MYITPAIAQKERVYGSWLLMCAGISHLVAEHATTVVSDIGDDWSPKSPPLHTCLLYTSDIILRKQKWTDWNEASYYGRMFARSGGVAGAVEQMLKELKMEDFEFNPIVCDGIDKCRTALLKASKGVLPNNFIEGMACVGGCIGGHGNPARHEDTPEELSLIHI